MLQEKRIRQLKEAVAAQRELMFQAERHIWKHPETGYREWKTNEYLKTEFEKLGYQLTMAGNIPGFYTDLDTGRPGPKVLIMGEMDSLIVTNHPECDPGIVGAHGGLLLRPEAGHAPGGALRHAGGGTGAHHRQGRQVPGGGGESGHHRL